MLAKATFTKTLPTQASIDTKSMKQSAFERPVAAYVSGSISIPRNKDWHKIAKTAARWRQPVSR
jgi:hypothetical protein